jgi:hypothetical protein
MKFAVGDTVIARDMAAPQRNGLQCVVLQTRIREDGFEMARIRFPDGNASEYFTARFDLVEAAPLQAGDVVVANEVGVMLPNIRGTVIKAWGHFVIVDFDGHKTRALGRKRFTRVEAAGGFGHHGPHAMVRREQERMGVANVAAAQQLHWLLLELRKMSDDGARHPGTCSYIKGNSQTQRISGQWADVCHARLNEAGYDECALWVNHNCHMDTDEMKEAHKAFVDWQINRGPFKDCYLTKDIDVAFKYGVLLDTKNFPIHQLKGAAIMLRTGTEYKGLLYSWWALRKEGISESAAYLTACQALQNGKGGAIRALNVSGAHHIMQRGQGMDQIRDRFTTPMTAKWEGVPYAKQKGFGDGAAINTNFAGVPNLGSKDIINFTVDVVKQSEKYGRIVGGYGGKFLEVITEEGRMAIAKAFEAYLNNEPIPQAVAAPKKLEEQDL